MEIRRPRRTTDSNSEPEYPIPEKGNLRGRSMAAIVIANLGGYKGYYLNMIGTVCAIALFIISCMAIGGKLPATAVGKYGIGFGAGMGVTTFLNHLSSKNTLSEGFHSRKGSIIHITIASVLFMGLGALALSGVLSAYKAGVGMLVGGIGLGVLYHYYFKKLDVVDPTAKATQGLKDNLAMLCRQLGF